MRTLIVLARHTTRSFWDLSGRSILADLPFRTVVFADRAIAGEFAGLGEHVAVQIVHWSSPRRVVDAAVSLAQSDDVFAVAALDEDMVDLAAEIRGRLGINGLDRTGVDRFRDKVAMKRFVQRAGIRVPEFMSCADRESVQELLLRHGAVVLKPVRGQGSRDVAFVRSQAELDAWYASCDDPDRFEAEEFIDGTLFHLNAVVRDRASILVACARYAPGMSNIDFTSGTPFVTMIVDDDDLSHRLAEYSNKVVAALDIVNGVTHLECFVTPSNEVVFCEIALRPGGGGIVWMIEAQYGVNFALATILLEAGLGDRIRVPPVSRDGVVGLSGFRTAQSGFVETAATIDDFPEDWIHFRSVDVIPGAFKPASFHCTDFSGLLVFSAKDQQDFDRRCAELWDRYDAATRIQLSPASKGVSAMTKIDLRDCKYAVDAHDADLSTSAFDDVSLAQSHFHRVTMEGAEFAEVGMGKVQGRVVNFAGAVFEGCNFTGVHISASCYDGMTIEGASVAELLAAHFKAKSEDVIK